ncbi:MAG TPA: hypothetical protein VFJ77_00295 [Gaiellaceae bacterium]|nr:hypothetical protein [Gaiellaceae bacterium]
MRRFPVLVVLAAAASLVLASAGSGHRPARHAPVPSSIPFPVRTLAGVTALPSPLPSGWIVFDSNRCPLPATTCTTTQEWEVYAQDPLGNVYQVTDSPTYDSWWPKLSPDRKKILFLRTDAGQKEQDWSKNSLWVVPVNASSGPIKLVGSYSGAASPNAFGWLMQGHEEWAPHQDAIVTIGLVPGHTTQIFVIPFTDATNTVGTPYQVSHGATATSDRPGNQLDPSWNPDEGSILFIGCALNTARTACDSSNGGSQELILTASAPGVVVEFQRSTTTDGTLNFDPYYAPDGSQIAWLHEDDCTRWDVRHATATGGSLATVVDDGAINSKPAWTSDSSTIYFHRYGSVSSTIWSVAASGGSAAKLGLGTNPATVCSSTNPWLTSGAPGTPVGPSPTLPAGAVVFASNRCVVTPCTGPNPNWEIYSRSSSGTITQLTNNAAYDSYGPKVSPDRSSILFYRSTVGESRNSADADLWIMKADGTLYPVYGKPAMVSDPSVGPFHWVRQSGANWSHDGNEIVFAASNATQEAKGPGPDQNNQIYWVQYLGNGQVGSSVYQATWGASGTGDRPGNNVEPSWNPDGGSILFVGCTPNAGRTACDGVHSSREIQLISSASHAIEVARTTTTDGTGYAFPVESPNGTTIAAIHERTCTAADVVKLPSTGGTVTTLVNTGSLNSWPAWTADSSRIYFEQLPATVGPNVWKITPHAPSPPGPDGTGLTQVTGLSGGTTPCAQEYPNLGQ